MSKFLLILELEESSELGLLSSLEVSHGNSLEVGHVSHFVFSMLSFFSGGGKSGNNSSSSSEFFMVGSKVISLVLSSTRVDILELSSLGADESSLVEAVSVHPVRSTDDSNTSGVSTFGAIGLSLTPVLELEALTVNPSVTLSGLAGTDPVSLDVRLDHLSDLVLFLGGEDRYELTTPFAANTSGVVPGLLLLEDLELGDHLVGDSLEVVSFGLGNSSSLGFSGGLLSFSSGMSGGSAGSSLLLLLSLDLGSGGFVSLSFLDLGMGNLSNMSIFSSLLFSNSSFLGVVVFLDLKFLGFESSFSGGSLVDSSSSFSGLLLSDLFVIGESLGSGSSFMLSSLFSKLSGFSLSGISSVLLGLSNSSSLFSNLNLAGSVSLSLDVSFGVNLHDNSSLVRIRNGSDLSSLSLFDSDCERQKHNHGGRVAVINSVSSSLSELLISVGARLQGSSLRYSHCEQSGCKDLHCLH